jgi:hypothetical protein
VCINIFVATSYKYNLCCYTEEKLLKKEKKKKEKDVGSAAAGRTGRSELLGAHLVLRQERGNIRINIAAS